MVIVLCGLALGAVPDASASTCTRWAAAHGNDQAAGTAARPFRTVGRLLRALPRGGTGCLRRGSRFRENVTFRRPVTLRSVGGRATIFGRITIPRRVPNVRLSGLTVRGGGSRKTTILVHGDRARIVGNDISGPGFRNRNSPCILLDGTRDVRIEANRIHNCSRVTHRNVYAPGILVSSALRTHILHNVVYHTLGDGIALGPNAQRTRVARNIVDGNSSGIYIGGNRRTASSYNVVTRNVISNSGRWNVHSVWSGPTGKGNVVASNCLWHGFGGATAGRGFRLVGNVKASPRFRNRPHDFTMGSGRCLAMHPRIVKVSRSVLPSFRVEYRLRALPDRVQIVRLTLSGLTRGVHLSLRCTSRCGTKWRGQASAPTLALPVLRGAWLRRGATVEVKATRGGWIGHVARIVVTGLPRGVKVIHGRTA
jgi:hypothetical protein